MSFMAALHHQPLFYAAAPCRAQSSLYRPPRPVPSGASSSCSFTPTPTSLSASNDEFKVSPQSHLSNRFGPGEVLPSITDKHSETDGEHRQASTDRPFWLDLIVRWVCALETRRTFITGSLQRLSIRLPSPPLPPLRPTQLSIAPQPIMAARRVALMIPFVVAASAPWRSFALSSTMQETAHVGRSFLQNLGIGDRDIYYPRLFEGSWICKSTLVSVDTPQGEEKADSQSIKFSRKQLGYTVTYRARFIPFQKHVIGDRLFTTQASQNQTRYRWDPTNEMVSDIEAFQRVSMYPVVQDSLSNIDILNLDKPITVYKYIVRFSRESS